VTERFVSLAKVSMKGNGMASAPMVVLPKTELTEYVSKDAMEAVAQQALGEIVAQLAPGMAAREG
jgi:hypothetical protein